MRRTTIYRLLQRSIFVLILIWILYSIQELTTKSYSQNDEFENIPPNIHIEEPDIINRHINVQSPKRFQEPKQLNDDKKDLHRKNVHKILQELKLRGEYMKLSNNGNKLDNKHDTNLIKEEKLMQTGRKAQQLEKLAEMGGKLIEKRHQEYFTDVNLPPFNDKQDPTGLGELGRGVHIDIKQLSNEEKSKYHKGWGANSFNQYASDLISIHRSLPDGRSHACKEQASRYNNHLQDISVIIIFHNEAWSVLLRSVHSILSRTPDHLLREVILVDDYSEIDHLKDPLEKYFNAFPKVQIVRAVKRQGLTRSRLLGYYVSSAPIVVFLDSHIECFPGWAEPLISRINEDHTRVVFPSIEVISDEELQTSCNTNVNQNGIFVFKDLTFQWQTIPQFEMNRRQNDADPIRSPTMPGGLFAISREFFERLGTYDPGLDYWGGENIELSFKAWMCGGSLEMVTCSHIGHIFRRTNPIHWTHNIGSKNSIRVAEVWMDDYKNYFYERILYSLGDYGDVTDRKILRENLKCQSFEWYIQHVYPNINIPSGMKYAGEIRSVSTPRCVDSMGGLEQNQPAPKLYPCHNQGYNQFWYLSDVGQIHQDDLHICISNGKLVSYTQCTPEGATWIYREDQTLLHIPTNLCLTASVLGDDLSISNCTNNTNQKWIVQRRRSDLKFPK